MIDLSCSRAFDSFIQAIVVLDLHVMFKSEVAFKTIECHQFRADGPDLAQEPATRRGEPIPHDVRVALCGFENAGQQVTDDRAAEACGEEPADHTDATDVQGREDAMSRVGSLRRQETLRLVVAQRTLTDTAVSSELTDLHCVSSRPNDAR